MTLAHDNTKPGLRLKQRVGEGSLTPQEAINLLRGADPVHGKQSATYRWLIARGAK